MAEATLAPINLREGESVTLRRDENFVVVNEGHYSFRYAGPFVTITRECDPASAPDDSNASQETLRLVRAMLAEKGVDPADLVAELEKVTNPASRPLRDEQFEHDYRMGTTPDE